MSQNKRTMYIQLFSQVLLSVSLFFACIGTSFAETHVVTTQTGAPLAENADVVSGYISKSLSEAVAHIDANRPGLRVKVEEVEIDTPPALPKSQAHSDFLGKHGINAQSRNNQFLKMLSRLKKSPWQHVDQPLQAPSSRSSSGYITPSSHLHIDSEVPPPSRGSKVNPRGAQSMFASFEDQLNSSSVINAAEKGLQDSDKLAETYYQTYQSGMADID